MNSKKLKFGGLALAAFVAAMGLSACAGENGADGQPGKDGVDGKEGSSCTATALKDDSGYILSCGGEVVGSILNGKDGVQGIAGADGKSCSAAPNVDASGYDISCDGKVVGTILNGTNGVDGNDGADGESCSATALVDGSGFTLTCGGEEIGTILNGTAGTSCSAALNAEKTGYTLTCGDEVVGTILNGTNGIDGVDGTSCSAALNAAKTGYTLTCGDQVVGTILNGTDGADGESCSATALVDGSGFTLTCGDKKVGVIKNGVDGADGKDGVDGTSCSAALNSAKTGYTLTCGGKVVGTILNGANGIDGVDGSDGADGVSCSATALEDGSGFTLICGDEEIGVIKNGVDGAPAKVVYPMSMMVSVDNMNEFVVSSSGAVSAGSVPSASRGKGGFETWYGDGYQINTGADDGSNTSGLWYAYSDAIRNGGSSTFNWPVAVENWDNLASVIDACGGMCGSVEMGPGYDFPFAGFGFNVINNNQEGADITAWNGLCIAYTAGGTEGFRAEVQLESSDAATYTAYNDYRFVLPLNSARIVNIPWTAFTQEDGWGNKVNRAELLKRVASVKFKFTGAAGESGYFSVQRIGMYGQCGSAPVSNGPTLEDYNNLLLGQVGKGFDAWSYAESGTRVLTADITDPENSASGYWRVDVDKAYKQGNTVVKLGPNSKSPTEVITDLGRAISDATIEACDGVCGTATFAANGGWAHVNVFLSQEKYEGMNAISFLGVCMEYELQTKLSSAAAGMTLFAGAGGDAAGDGSGNQLSFTLDHTTTGAKVIDIPWAAFENPLAKEGLTTKKIVSNLNQLKAVLWGNEAGDVYFKINKIGAYGTCN